MAVKLKCRCGQLLDLSEADAGRTVRCTACGYAYRVSRGARGKLSAWALKSSKKAPRPTAGADARSEDLDLELEQPARPAPPSKAAARRAPSATQPARPPGPVIAEKAAQAPEAAEWRESFFGAFAYAYAAVVAGQGWKAWLQYAAIGTSLSVLIGFMSLIPVLGWLVLFAFFLLVIVAIDVKFILPLLFIFLPLLMVFGPGPVLFMFIAIGAPVGAMYFYMGQAAALGARPLEEASPNVIDDIITPAVLVLLAEIVLGFIPMAAVLLISGVARGTSFGEGDLTSVLRIGSTLMASAIPIATFLFVLFCFPMVAMVLAASESVLKALNPVNVFRAIGKAPLEYLAVWVFCVLNIALTPVILLVVSTAVGLMGGPLFGMLFAFAGAMALACYMMAACGWRMGIFLLCNPQLTELLE